MRRKSESYACMFFLLLHASICLVQGDIMPPPSIGKLDGDPSKQVIETFHVQTDIRYRFATTKMCSIVRNTAGVAQEMEFGVTLPKEAFIVSFAMTIDGKVYDGEVKEKKAAKEQYHKAVMQGQSAGHIRQKPRHSNRFDMSVNVANGSAVNFTLIYQQILSRKLGLYEYEMHVEPGQAVEDFKVEVFIQENRPLLFVKTPQIRKASTEDNAIIARSDLTTVDRPSDKTAHIQYIPTVKQQGIGGLSARFVVQYDIEHSDKGDVLVADGYFIHLFSPKPKDALPKDIIFVLDVSGSMSGTKIQQLKEAMKAILTDLKEDDRLNILTFSGDVSKWKRNLTPVTSEIVDEAKQFVNTMRANGGTNINDALLNALAELQGREVQSRAGMIFFLTDGEATSGETNAANIARNVKSKNTDQTSIYSLAFGQGANFELLKTISTGNFGYARKIYEASDAALQVETLYDEISTVAMKNVTVKYLPSVTKTTTTVFPVVQNGTEILIGGCIDIRGWRDRERRRGKEGIISWDDPSVFRAEIEGTQKEGEVDILLEIDDIDEITIDPEDSLNSFFTMPRDYSGIVEKMWAFLTIKQMLREKQGVIEDKAKVEELDKKILEMSLQYKFVTPLTSMVVTKPDEDTPVESGLEDADKLMSEAEDAYSSPVQAYYPPSHGIQPRGPASASFSNMGSVPARNAVYFSRRRGGGSRRYGHPSSKSTVPKMSSTHAKYNSGGSRKRTQRRRKGKKTPGVGILRTIVFRNSDQSSLCLQLKKVPDGKYLLAQADGVANSSKGFKVELDISCLKNCRVLVPKRLDLTSGGRTTQVNLTALNSWEYSQHSDFDVTFVKMNEMILEHDSVVISIVRSPKGKKMFFTIELRLKGNSPTLSSSMSDLVLKSKGGRKRKQRRVPKACLSAKADTSLSLMKKKALKYKV